MTSPTTPEIIDTLQRHNQTHLLRWWDELDAQQQSGLIEQIESIDFDLIQQLLEKHCGSESVAESPQEKAQRATSPAELVRLPTSDDDEAQWNKATRTGEEVLAAGKVGVILVAGGQGTRLGFDKPKGMYPIGPVSGNSLFQILVEQAIARSRRAGVSIPYYVMTSEATHTETEAYFRQNRYFGLESAEVHFFQQQSMPAVDDTTGRLLVEDKGKIATGPDGHGGMLAALSSSGLLDEMRNRGIEILYYHQVDNPTSIVCDPAFLGFHVLRNSEMSTKVVEKRSAEEKMGVVVDIDSQMQIIEYSDLPDEIVHRTDSNGNLLLWAGSMAIHLFNREFLERLNGQDEGLPFHIAHKTVPYLDDTGEQVNPESPNAYKFERFIFDAMPAAQTALVVEADRPREFNPVKNAEGDDSPKTCRAAMTAIFSNWLKQAGAGVSVGIDVEISPLFALDSESVQSQIDAGIIYRESVFLDVPLKMDS
jgi:UDP-N-acetylglucosamine/UDP-N-acetylgalactosamine diphosphorylase